MPDREKVISALECISNGAKQPCHDCEYSKREEWCIAECAKDALALLKAQEPLEPAIVNGEPECAECLYELRSDADSYCPCCGRKVKWE